MTGEFSRLCKDGTIGFHTFSAKPVSDSGQIVGIEGFILDTTERRKSIEQLRESEKELSAILTNFNKSQSIAKIGSLELDIASGKVWWSEELYRIFGVDPEKYTPSVESNATFVHPDDNEPFHNAVFKAIETGEPIDYDIRIITPSAELKYCRFLAHISLNEDNKAEKLIGTFSDITERKLTEATLHETQAILQAAMDQSPAGIAIANAPNGDLRYVNKAGLFIRGGDNEELVRNIDINKYVGSWHILGLDGIPLKPEEVPLARAVLFGEKNSREFIIRRTIGDDRIVFANAAPIRDGNGKVIAGIVVFLDITERKHAEEEIKKQMDELRRWYEITLNREGRVLELKQEVNELLKQHGELLRYESAIPDYPDVQ